MTTEKKSKVISILLSSINTRRGDFFKKPTAFISILLSSINTITRACKNGYRVISILLSSINTRQSGTTWCCKMEFQFYLVLLIPAPASFVGASM